MAPVKEALQNNARHEFQLLARFPDRNYCFTFLIPGSGKLVKCCCVTRLPKWRSRTCDVTHAAIFFSTNLHLSRTHLYISNLTHSISRCGELRFQQKGLWATRRVQYSTSDRREALYNSAQRKTTRKSINRTVN